MQPQRSGPEHSPGVEAAGAPPCLVDAHVHLYGCFERDRFFDAAHANFAQAARSAGDRGAFSGALLFSEGAGEQAFARLAEAAGAPRNGRWRVVRTEEPESLLLRADDGRRLWVAAGRQIVTVEGLEVLALLTPAAFPDGEPLDDTLARVQAADAVPVLPWGFGKWLGRRGRRLRALLARTQPRDLFLGDNAGRPFFWPRPAPFRAFEAAGGHVLPGSDPLPFPSEADRPGRFGFRMQAVPSETRPAESLRRALRSSGFRPIAYGRLERAGRFARHQVAMQLRKRSAETGA